MVPGAQFADTPGLVGGRNSLAEPRIPVNRLSDAVCAHPPKVVQAALRETEGMTLLTAYRVLAYVTGAGLVLLVCVAMPLKYVADQPEPTAVIGQLHGFLYALYVVVTLVLAYVRRWSLLKALLILLAGTVPFVTFYAERRVVRAERAAAVEASRAEEPTN